MRGPTELRFASNSLVTAALAFLAALLNPFNALLGRVLPAREAAADWTGLVLASLCHGLVVSWLIAHTRLRGLALSVWLFVLYAGINGCMAQVETWLFLSVWNPVLSATLVGVLWLHLVSFGACFALLVGLAFRRTTELEHASVELLCGSALLRRLALSALAYVPIYFAAGALIAIPLAGDAFEHVYGQLTVPTWMPLVQLGRGLLWAGLAWLTLRFSSGTRNAARITCSLVLTLPMDAGLLIKNPLFPDAMRFAHGIEILISMLLYGWLVSSWLLVPQTTRAQRLTDPLASRAGT